MSCSKNTCGDCDQCASRAVVEAIHGKLFDSVLDGVSAQAVNYGPSPLASAMPVGQSLVESLRELNEKFNTVPSRPAYLVMPPDMYAQLPITPIEWPADGPDRSMMGFRILQGYDFKLSVPRSIVCCDIGGSDPYVPPVVWKDVQSPAKPSAMIWCVVVAFLCWVLCAAAGML